MSEDSLVEAWAWKIIDASRDAAGDDAGRQLAVFRESLDDLSPAQLIAFHEWFNRKSAGSYSWDLWGAAYLINGGCSDDGFAYFRAWLISRGHSTYLAAVRDPDSLADVVDADQSDYEFEEFWYVSIEVYQAKTGKEYPGIDFDWPSEPIGDRWDFDDAELSRRLPRLAALYG